jgi:hypothetical protein
MGEHDAANVVHRSAHARELSVQVVPEAARTITAWASGFISMELAGAFKLGGNIDRAYEFGIACLADALVGQVHRPQQ